MTVGSDCDPRPEGEEAPGAYASARREPGRPEQLPDLEQARRFLTLLGGADAVHHFRAIDPKGTLSPYKCTGTFDQVADNLRAANAQGYGIFVGVNEGGPKKGLITRVRAVFADFDSSESWKRVCENSEDLRIAGRDPHIVVQTSPGKFHVYWKVEGLPLESFEGVQRGIADRLGSDPAVHDLSRVMRLPGFIHTKGAPWRSSLLLARDSQPPFTEREIVAAFPPAHSYRSQKSQAPIVEGLAGSNSSQAGVGKVVDEARHADILQVAGQMARKVAFEGLGREAGLALLIAERERGRWTRTVSDGELISALDDGIAKCRAGDWRQRAAANDADMPIAAALSDAVEAALTPFTDEELARAAKPHPHLFTDGSAGIFPVGEVTIVAAPGREGKTYAIVHMAAACVLGRSIGGLPADPKRAIIYSNEDDRIQYARKILAIAQGLDHATVSRLRAGLLVPDLEVPGLVEARAIVAISEKRRPVPTPMVSALIKAVRSVASESDPIGLMVFETASTLSDADEDNAGLKTLVAALKRIARELAVAVCVVHHTNQSASENLPALNVSVNDIRGATALAFNARQCFLLVNLGAHDDPFGRKDMRTHVRNFVAPFSAGRVTALVCLDSSKCLDPPPIFLAWMPTKFGPRMAEISVPEGVQGTRWRKLRQAVIDWVLKERKEEKEEQINADVLASIEMAGRLHAAGKHPTVRAVSLALGRGADWARTRLDAGVSRGMLDRVEEHVPNTKGKTDVYRPKASAQQEECDADGFGPVDGQSDGQPDE